MVKYVFFHSKLRKQPFFAEVFQIHWGQGLPLPLLPTSESNTLLCANLGNFRESLGILSSSFENF